MIDIIFPKNNESEFIQIAEKLGLDGLIFVYDKKKDIAEFQKSTKLRLYSATTKKIIRNIGEARGLLEKSKDCIIYDLEDQDKDFTKARNSGLNEVLIEIGKKNGITMGFSFSLLLSAKRKSIILGRMRQNAMLCRKKKAKVIFASFARSPWGMRAKTEIEALAKELGLSPKEVFLNHSKAEVLSQQND